jgi:succinate dehydrogenase/fumarate reductase flavoprotein subunit
MKATEKTDDLKTDDLEGQTRRSFIRTTGLIAVGVAAAGLSACGAETDSGEQKEREAWLPEAWADEADILILGFGLAGASAAIAANMQGQSALILEVAPKESRGGNSACCGGGWVNPWDKDLYLEHLKRLCFNLTPEKYLKDWVEADMGIIDWMDELEIEHRQTVHNYSHFFTENRPPMDPTTGKPAMGGVAASGIDQNRALTEDGSPAVGKDLFRMFAERVEAREIPVLYETRAIGLVQNPYTKEVVGCKATDKAGNTLYYKGTKAVLLCVGGYENNPTLTDNHVLPGIRLYPSGTTYNVGDGIYMASETGAEIWHMAGIEWVGYGIRVLGDDLSTFSDYRNLNTGFIVNKRGERMYNEDKNLVHTKEFPATYFKGYADDTEALNDFWGIPSYVIFDETRRLAGSTGFFQYGGMGLAYQRGLYEWSENNSKEIASGLIKKGDTIRELAEKAGIFADGLEATFNRFNENATQGLDPDFGRTVLAPLATPPFYAIEVVPTLINTQGGPKHSNLDGRCLNHNDEVIPRLYACGECGSVYSMLYHGSGNVAEAIMTGKLAAENAAELEPWV